MKGGEAYIYSSPKGHILAAIVELNNLHYQTLDENVDFGHAGEVRQYIACHEIGHALGLGHDLGEFFMESCMIYADVKEPKPNQKSKLTANMTPSQHDFEEIEKVSAHTHDEDQALGVFCREETDKTIRTYYLQRVTYNGVKAFAQKERTLHKVNPQTQGPHFVRFDREDEKRVAIRWERLNLNKMLKHTDERTGEFSALNNGEMRAKVTTDSRYESVEKKLLTLLRDGKINGGPVGCTKLTEEQAKDVSRFIPPKNGQGSGSYRRFQKTENLDGSRSDAPDVEIIYKYVKIKGLTEIIPDPVIKPFTTHDAQHR